MTREEAIMYWEDFLGEIDQMEVDDCWTNEDAETQREATKMAISALRHQELKVVEIDQVNPLTMDELRQMDGEPVWVCFIDGVVMRDDGWFILALLNESQAILEGKHTVYKNLSVYGKTWIAYRQKPEEGTV